MALISESDNRGDNSSAYWRNNLRWRNLIAACRRLGSVLIYNATACNNIPHMTRDQRGSERPNRVAAGCRESDGESPGRDRQWLPRWGAENPCVLIFFYQTQTMTMQPLLFFYIWFIALCLLLALYWYIVASPPLPISPSLRAGNTVDIKIAWINPSIRVKLYRVR